MKNDKKNNLSCFRASSLSANLLEAEPPKPVVTSIIYEMVNSLKILPCRYHAALFAVLAITRPRLQNIVDIFRLITITIQKHFPESKSVLDSGKYFGFLQVFLDSRKYFVFLELFLDSGKCF